MVKYTSGYRNGIRRNSGYSGEINMYKILIVDDERRERAGLENLIHRYKYPLDVLLAANGEEALEVFEREDIDILLTDIKMPFMTGIELIDQVRKRGYTPFCIIFSAYGEFEYAQNAISLGVIQYLLKPVLLDDFQKLFDKVCRLCEEKEKRIAEDRTIMEEKKNKQTIESFKEFLLYLEDGDYSEEDKKILEMHFLNKKYRLIILSSYSFLFSIHWKDYEADLRKITGNDTLVINMDDSQILLVVPTDGDESERWIKNCCEEIINISKAAHQFHVFMVVSSVCSGLAGMRSEYEKLYEILDYQFFISESSYILYDKEYVNRKQSDMLPVYFNKILTYAKLKDYSGIKKEFHNVFQYIDRTVGFSSIYIKYSFTDLMKKLCENLKAEYLLLDVAEKLYEVRTLETMKRVVLQLIDEMEKNDEANDTDSRLVQMAKRIVSERYQEMDFGVSYIAGELHVSLAYLSALFKMETGQTLVKYITAYRMEQAKCLLETSNMKISDVAQKTGYLNTSYFISLFKNREGCSPQQYREKKFGNEEAK